MAQLPNLSYKPASNANSFLGARGFVARGTITAGTKQYTIPIDNLTADDIIDVITVTQGGQTVDISARVNGPAGYITILTSDGVNASVDLDVEITVQRS